MNQIAIPVVRCILDDPISKPYKAEVLSVDAPATQGDLRDTTNILLGLYELPLRSGEAHLYRLNHPPAEAVIEQAKLRVLPTAEVRFDDSGRSGKVSLLEPLMGKSGWLTLSRLSVEALD